MARPPNGVVVLSVFEPWVGRMRWGRELQMR